MKRNIFLFCASIIVICFSCESRESKIQTSSEDAVKSTVSELNTRVAMIDSVYNFGRVKEGEKVVFSYRFKNAGNNPLVVSSTYASCGCTVPEKPEQPIAPGQSGYIKIIFNSEGTGGAIHKQVRVISNARPDFPLLTLTGEVMAN